MNIQRKDYELRFAAGATCAETEKMQRPFRAAAIVCNERLLDVDVKQVYVAGKAQMFDDAGPVPLSAFAPYGRVVMPAQTIGTTFAVELTEPAPREFVITVHGEEVI